MWNRWESIPFSRVFSGWKIPGDPAESGISPTLGDSIRIDAIAVN
jgi:hypothetical protein